MPAFPLRLNLHYACMSVCVCVSGSQSERERERGLYLRDVFRGTVKLKHPKGQEHASSPTAPSWFSRSYSPPTHRPLTIGLVTHAQDDLRGAVVACNHIGRHKKAGGSSSGQAEVQNLQGAIRLYHNVARLQVLSRHTTQAWFRGGGTRCWFEGGIGQTFRNKNPRLQTYSIYL